MPKRPIDIKRDAAAGMSIGDEDEPITGFVTFLKRMLIVKAKSIYEVKLADQIDPGRTNINVPNTNQKVLDYGSETTFVGRTLLTAQELFKDRYLAMSSDECGSCISFAFDAVKDVAAMHEIAIKMATQETVCLASIATLKAERGAVSVPSVGNVESRLKELIQKADHTLQSLFFIVKIFYPDQKNMFEGLAERMALIFGKDDALTEYLMSNLKFIGTVRRARNAVEHPNDKQKIVCSDFLLQSDGTITPPLIELVDNKYSFGAMSLTKFMAEISEQVVNVFESMTAGLCDKHEREINGLRFHVNRFQAGEQGLSKHVRYSHALLMGGHSTRAQ